MKHRSNYWQLSTYVRPQWKIIAQAMVCTLMFTATWPVLAWLAGRMAELIGAGKVSALAELTSFAAVVWVGQKLVQYGQDTLMAKAALSIALQLRKQAYAHLQHLSLSYFETMQTGDLAYRLTEDVDRIGEVVNKLFHEFVPNVLRLIAVLGYMIWVNWQLTLATLIIAPLLAVIIGWFGERLRKLSHRSQSRVSDLSG
ncbi:MAG: ABC transporter ATP-binding protein, partial [Phormidesmis sp. CAN_BIN44]|nr:ABC transporter ATP-binding protein [Phormidesmis sp. CAN_BIN44]